VGRRKDTGEKPLNHTSHIKAAETKKHRKNAGKNTRGTSDEPQGTLSHTYYHAKMEETKEGNATVYIIPCLARKSGNNHGTPD